MNVPLKEGMTDEAYEKLFKPVMRKVMEIYQPEAIVFQSGQQLHMRLTPMRAWLHLERVVKMFMQRHLLRLKIHTFGVNMQERTH